MAARPRLVHEGAPIVEAESSGAQAPVAATWSHGAGDGDDAHRRDVGAARSNLAALAGESKSKPARKPYKLQTRLVIGDQSKDDEDDMMMMDDEDDHNQQSGGITEEEPVSQYYGAHGHVYHVQEQTRPQQGSNGVVEDRPASGYYQAHGHVYHQQQQQHVPQHQQPMHQPAGELFSNGSGHGFAHTNLIHHEASSNPPPPMYQMPSPETSPLVVLDAANIAYNYAESLNPAQGSQRRQPDPRGIRLAIEYFLKHNCRVQAVVPISWYQAKPRPGDHYHLQNRSRGDSDAKMVTDEVEELRRLRQEGFLVACPPGDDDDAYVLALARREEVRLLEHNKAHQQDESMNMEEDTAQQLNLPTSVLGGYVVSNDFFQDAIRRDERKQQHHHPLNMRPLSIKSWLKKNRISYSFANVGTSTAGGEVRLEFLPNPRNELVEAIDACSRQRVAMS